MRSDTDDALNDSRDASLSTGMRSRSSSRSKKSASKSVGRGSRSRASPMPALVGSEVREGVLTLLEAAQGRKACSPPCVKRGSFDHSNQLLHSCVSTIDKKHQYYSCLSTG